MKKGVFIIILFLLIANVNAITVINTPLTGKAVTGRATAGQTNISIQIISNLPSIILYNPENGTYIQNSSILLNYSSSGD